MGEGAAWRLLRWALLCAAVAGGVLLLGALGVLERMDEWQLALLMGDTLQLSTLDAQVTLLSAGATYTFSALMTAYLAAVLLHEPRPGRRSHICALAAAALVLPGCMCVLWHGVLYVGVPLACVLLLWLYMVPQALIRRPLS